MQVRLARWLVAGIGAGALFLGGAGSAWACNSNITANSIRLDGNLSDWTGLCGYQSGDPAGDVAAGVNAGEDLLGIGYTHSTDGNYQFFSMHLNGPVLDGVHYQILYTGGTGGGTVTLDMSCSTRNGGRSCFTRVTGGGLDSIIDAAVNGSILETGGGLVPAGLISKFQNSTITARVVDGRNNVIDTLKTPITGVAPDKFTGATAVALRSFTCSPTAAGVALQWETAAEHDTLGFYVRRGSPSGPRVNAQAIAGQLTSPVGARYQLVDPQGTPTTLYFLEEVARDGSHFHGPARFDLGASGPLAPKLRAMLRPRGLHARWFWKFGAELFAEVEDEGIYQLNAQALADAGLPVPSERLLRLEHQGRPVALQALPGRQGALFYAAPTSSPERRGDAYRISLGFGRTEQPVHVGGGDSRRALAPSFSASEHLEQHHLMDASAEAEDRFPWTFTFSGAGPATVTFDAPGHTGGAAKLAINLLAMTDFDQPLSHHARATLNHVDIGELEFGGTGLVSMEASIPAGLLQAQGNVLEVTALADLGVPYDILAISSLDVGYPRAFAAQDDRLAFTSDGTAPVKLDGFSAPPALFDVTDPASPIALEGFRVEASGNGYALRFNELRRPALRRYFAAVPRQPGLRGSHAAEVPAGSADYVVIHAAGFEDALQPLLALHRSQGLTTLAVGIDALEDRFNGGEHGPAAISKYLAQLSPRPRYVLLAGRASLDPHDYLATGVPDQVPTVVHRTERFGVFAASDAALATLAGAPAPFAAVGRLAVSEPEQLAAVVEKIVQFESGGAPSGKALFAADQRDPETSVDDPFFRNESDRLASQLPGLSPLKIYLPQQGRPELLSALAQAPDLVTYHGHGGATSWSTQNVLSTDDLAALPAARPFLLVTVDCWDGLFAMPGMASLSQALVELPKGGAIAAFSASTLVDKAHDPAIDDAIFGALQDPSVKLAGDLALRAQTRWASRPETAALVGVYNLLGDPAAHLPLH